MMKNSYQTLSLPAVMCCTILAALAAPAADAGNDIWTGAGDGTSFADPLNWSLGVVPGVLDDAIFDSIGGPITITSGPSTSNLFVNNALVNFGLGTTTYQVSGLLQVGSLPSEVARLELARGTVHVLDTPGVDDMVLGSMGDGTLFIRATAALAVDGEVLLGDRANGGFTIRGTANMGRCFVADNFGTTVSGVVDGASASWNIATLLRFGNGGDADLQILNGASLSTSTGGMAIGDDATSSGIITVDGFGSTVSAAAILTVGNFGVGTLNVQNAAALSAAAIVVGDEQFGNGIMTVDGSGTNATAAGSVVVGNRGVGTLGVQNAAALSGAAIFVGDELLSNGGITVDGAGSTAAATGNIVVANFGVGTLHVQNGGFASGGSLFIGDELEADGQLTVQGIGSGLSVAGAAKIANNGIGALDIVNGATASVGTNIGIGDNLGSNGRLTVQDAGSTLSVLGTAKIGNIGLGSLTIANGGMASVGGNMNFGDNLGAVGSCDISGAGSSLTGAAIFVGNFGTGTLNVATGGMLASTRTKVGDEIGSTGTLTVTDPTSQWIEDTETIVGNFGTGQLNIMNGGSASSAISTIGDDSPGNGSVLVDGNGSTWQSSARLRVGNFGSGTLTIQNGGSVSASRIQIGFDNNSSGNVTVDSLGSVLSAVTNLRNGRFGTGSLTIIDGGEVDAGGGYIQEANGTLQAVLGADTVTMIAATGTADIAGGLTVTLASGFTPTPGAEFTLVSAPVVSGIFSSVSLPMGFELIYAADSVFVRAGAPTGVPATLTGITMVNGSLLTGGLPELLQSDDQYVRTRSFFGDTVIDLHNMEMRVTASTAVTAPTSFSLAIETHINQPSGLAQIRMKDWNTGNDTVIGQYALGAQDGVQLFQGLDATRFVNGLGEMEISIKHIVFIPIFAFLFESFIDHVEILVTG